MKYILVIVILFSTSGCVHGFNDMNAIMGTLASIGSRTMQYHSHGVGLNSNGDNSVTMNGVRYETGRSGSFEIDNGRYGIGNGAGGWVKTPHGIVTNKGVSVRNNGHRIRF